MDDEATYVSIPCWTRDGDGWCFRERRVRALPPEDHAEDDESLSVTNAWQTVACHGLQVGEEVKRIAAQAAPPEAELLHSDGRWQDLGKAHAAFQRSIQADDRRARLSRLAPVPKHGGFL